jgi:hypothetical protein
MSHLYLVCSHSCMSQMELPYLLNNSPELHGTSGVGQHWATYELNGAPVDGENGPLGTVRVHDDYWNLDMQDRVWYNFDIRNAMNISRQQIQGLLNISDRYGKIALLLHAHNVRDIYKWTRELPVTLITTSIGEWESNIEYWAMREFNEIMEDDANANYSTDNHNWPGIDGIVEAYLHRRNVDETWRILPCDIHIQQAQWQRLPDLYNLWEHVGVAAPAADWIDDYYQEFQSKQVYNTPLLTELRSAYERHYLR